MARFRGKVQCAAVVSCALALAVGAPGAIGARRPATPGASRSATQDTVQIGPITARDGFAMYVTARGCGSADPSFEVAYLAGRAPGLLIHTYTGVDASCTLAGAAGAAELRASLPGTIDIAADITASDRPLKHPGLPVGCGAPFGPEFAAVATGQIDVAIHTAVFGRLNTSRANAAMFTDPHQQCPAVQPSSSLELTADLGAEILDASKPTHGPPAVDIYDSSGDTPAPGLTGTLELELGEDHAYVLTSDSGSAQIGSAAPLATGSLTFTALPACPGATAVNGTMAGTLTIEDPLLGPLALRGSDATLAYTGAGDAQAGGCNGPGSQPVEPELVSDCDVDGSCSVQAGTNTVTFSDETDPGTQTISSEQVEFGDGSATAPLTPGGVLTHTYSQPGTYVVTLTVVDAAGVTSTASSEVYVDP